MYAIFDCDNCFVSCERVMRPELEGKPVVVLSNNDGCVVARSQEAKRLGVRAGMPYFKMKDMLPGVDVIACSGNHELYRDITRKVMDIIEADTPEFHRYSIDEAFCLLDGMERIDLKRWGEEMSAKIKRMTRMPVSIGIASTKTLAKCADRFAKDYPGYNKCCIIDTEERRRKALRLFSIDEVWGIGRRLADKLSSYGIRTAYDFAEKPKSWIRHEFHLTAEQTWLELNGEDCIPTRTDAKKKSISNTRTFATMTSDYEQLHSYISNFAVRCSESLRQQHSVCSTVTVFIKTNRFRTDLRQYTGCISLNMLTPDNSAQGLVACATKCLERIYKPDFLYKRAGVTVSEICDENVIQTNFLDFDAEQYSKLKRLSKAIDSINQSNGRQTVMLGSQQFKKGTTGIKTVIPPKGL